MVGDHLQGKLIVVAQKNRPLTIGRNLRRLPQDVGDRKTVLLGQRHIHAWHQGKMESHVALVAFAAFVAAEIQLGVLGPLIGLCQQHAIRVAAVELCTNLLKYHVGFRQVFIVGAVTLDQIRNGIQA